MTIYGKEAVEMTKALFVRPNVAALCIRRLSCSVQPRLPAMVKCYSIAVRSYRPMKQLSHIGLKFEAFAGHRSFSIRATSDTGSSSFDSPLMQSMEKKVKFIDLFFFLSILSLLLLLQIIKPEICVLLGFYLSALCLGIAT